MDRPPSRWSRRIRSNCSTLDLSFTPTPSVIALADVTERKGRSGRGWGHFKASLSLQVGPHQAGTLTRVAAADLRAARALAPAADATPEPGVPVLTGPARTDDDPTLA